MPHDATKILLGSTLSSAVVITAHDGDPATYKAGLGLRLKSDGTLSFLLSDGSLLGISTGKSLSNHKKTAIARKGLRIPLKTIYGYGNVTITSYANLVSGTADTVTIGETVFTAQSGAATPGTATFRAATDNDTTATSLATQINAHATAGALVKAEAVAAVVHLKSLSSGATIALAYADNGTATVGATVSGAALANLAPVKGTAVYLDDETGQATYSSHPSAVVTQGIYSEGGTFTGVDEDGSTYLCAVVDMTAGL